MTRMAIYLARDIRLDGLAAFEAEKTLIRARGQADHRQGARDGRRRRRRSARCARSKPASWIFHGRRTAIARAACCPRATPTAICAFLDAGLMPFPKDVLAVHEEGLRRRAEREKLAFGPDLAVQSVYEISEPVAKLLPRIGTD
jgi:hypothetical protein